MESGTKTWRERVSPLTGWHGGDRDRSSSSADLSQGETRALISADSVGRWTRWRAPLVSTASSSIGSAGLGACLQTTGAADDGLALLEDGESEGSAAGHTAAMPTGGMGMAGGGSGKEHRDEVKLTGWLYKHRKTRFRSQWHLRYFVLKGMRLLYFKSSSWQQETAVKDIPLTGRCRVEDTGRWTTASKELFTFCIHSDRSKPCLVGTKDPEFAAAWIHAMQEAMQQQQTGVFDSAATPLSTHAQAASNNSWPSDDEGEFQSSNRPTSSSWLSSESMEADSAREGGFPEGPMGEEDEEDEDDDFDSQELPREIVNAGPSLGAADVARAGPEGGPPGMLENHFQGVRRRGSVGFGPPQELGGMLEAMVALGSSSGIAGDGSWRLVRLANGLRFFEETETNTGGSYSRPCLSSVGTVDAPCESVFRLVMDLSPASRYEWDVAYEAARVVETQDGHTDCIHYKFKSLPVGPLMPLMHLAPRDLCLRRYWQRRADGCYVVLYQSMEHRVCPPLPNSVRAEFMYGGFFIAPGGGPSAPSARSIVMHVLDLDPKGWLPQCCGFPADLHFFLLGRVAGIRDFFSQTRGVAVSSLLGLPLSVQAEGHQNHNRGQRRGLHRRASAPAEALDMGRHSRMEGRDREVIREKARHTLAPVIPPLALGARVLGEAGLGNGSAPALERAHTPKSTVRALEGARDIDLVKVGRSTSLKDAMAQRASFPPGASLSQPGSERVPLMSRQDGRIPEEGGSSHHRSHSGPQPTQAEAAVKGSAEQPAGAGESQNQQPQTTFIPVASPVQSKAVKVNGDVGTKREWGEEERGAPGDQEVPASPETREPHTRPHQHQHQHQHQHHQQQQKLPHVPLLRPGMGPVKRSGKGRLKDRHAELQWAVKAGATLNHGPAVSGINCWSEAEEGLFSVRSRSYFQDKVKQPAGSPGLVLVAVDWLKKMERIDHVVELKRTPVQAAREKFAALPEDERPFFFIVNLQVPAAQHYSMTCYWMLPHRPVPGSLLARFVEEDDMFRNARLKLIPSIHQGAWVVKRSVGTTPLIVAGALQVAYFQEPDYIECDVDIGSSSVANGIVRFVLGYVRTLVVDMAFLFQSNAEEELPEELLGTVRVSHLEPNAALDLDLDSLKPQ